MKCSNDVLDFLSLWIKQIRSHSPKNHILNQSTQCLILNGFYHKYNVISPIFVKCFFTELYLT